VRSERRGHPRDSLRGNLYLNKIEEHTHTINFRWKIPLYDRPYSLSTAAKDLKESLLSLSDGRSKKNIYCCIDWETRSLLSSPQDKQKILVINCSEFPSNSPESISRFIAQAYKLGWKEFRTFGWRGQKFCGCGLGSQSNDVRIDVYGTPGDDLGSDLDGAEITVHGSASDRVGQKMKSGRMAIYGDVGHSFMQRATGGEVYVLGNVSGRPLTCSSGSPRVVINGTCCDQLIKPSQTERSSKNSGFVILNGLIFNEKGEIEDLKTPYSEECIFTLALDTTVYIRDPQLEIRNAQHKGVRVHKLNETDCLYIFRCLKVNEGLFNIDILDLITAENQLLPFHKVYHKVESIGSQVRI
jgi:hypothetical protein